MTALHLVDGTYELFRAHFSKRPEREAKATAGLVASMLWLLEDPEEQVNHVAIAFDNPIESFRNDLFAGYKTGDGVDPVLKAQFDLAELAAAAIGMTVWSMDRFEADDALATAAARWRDDVDQVRIMTPDKDLGQCVCGDRVVLVDRMRKRVIGEDELRARRGIAPASVPDWLALVGDSADGIPGVPGFGEKTAAKLLARYGTLEAIPDDPGAWDVDLRNAPRLAETLARMRKEAELYKRLAILVDDVPLEESLDDLEWRGVPRDEFESLCDVLALDALRERPQRWVG